MMNTLGRLLALPARSSAALRVPGSAAAAAPSVPGRAVARPPAVATPVFARFAGGGSPFMPKRRRHRVSQRGRIPFSLGGSERGTRLAWGDYGIRVMATTLLTARQLDAVRVQLRRVTRNIKGVKVHMRVFPDLPMTSKGIEVRMGKGKGSIDYWACRVRAGRVIFELVGEGLTEAVVKEATRAAHLRMPVACEMVKRNPADYAETGKIMGINATRKEGGGLRRGPAVCACADRVAQRATRASSA
ncbi:ribosomal protein L10e/L16 [Hyaloraphidium curvatum]|nr:ribosomal protein L10e/L16 [Hyaloraphidium curvatum]